ncbi:MAG: GNAT family N-acetyltransferase [Armatimonadota bacterium]|nr:GNAT family N-acetyltransferase [Armatimonadota bacterium]
MSGSKPENLPADCRVRAATIDDYERICELFDEIDSLHRGKLPHILREYQGPVRTREFVEAAVGNETQVILLAELARGIAGFAHVRMIDKSQEGPGFVPRTLAFIDCVVVGHEYRRRGIGRLLMKAAHAWGLDRGATSAELNVWAFNKGASDLYKELGYDAMSLRMSKPLR